MSAIVDARHELERWLSEHGDALYAYALPRVREAAAVEDLIQDTLIAAWQARASFRGGAAVRTWLIGILKHKIIDHLRVAQRETTLGAVADDEAERDPLAGRMDGVGHWRIDPIAFRDPRTILEQAELREAMRRCIEALPVKLRTVFVLKELDGLDSPELVAVAGISSLNHLWVMLSRARERVRACLERKWGREA
ncbi:MAG TPA: sigma-70 family RNA polymerase sigma factor [Gammaproteobacteria bacterium]|nr:sigma-70 family RNA polymerase sigma factor [Gammaproteobacteria bacterium]